MVLWGGSAGGTLAALVGLQGHPSVRGVVDWYGPSDLFEMARFTAGRDAPGESREDQWLGAPVASVPDAAAAGQPRAAGRRGCTAVPPRTRRRRHRRAARAQSGLLAEALRARGVEVELHLEPGAGHFWRGASDEATDALFDRAIAFARRVVA